MNRCYLLRETTIEDQEPRGFEPIIIDKFSSTLSMISSLWAHGLDGNPKKSWHRPWMRLSRRQGMKCTVPWRPRLGLPTTAISSCKNEKRQARPWLIENEKKLEVTAPSKCVLKLSWSCHDILRLKPLLANFSPLVPKPSLPPPKKHIMACPVDRVVFPSWEYPINRVS